MEKQLFYIVAVILLMFMAFRLMKKVDSNRVDDPYKIPENTEEKCSSDSEEIEESEEHFQEEENET